MALPKAPKLSKSKPKEDGDGLHEESNPLHILNMLGKAAHDKVQPKSDDNMIPSEHDGNDNPRLRKHNDKEEDKNKQPMRSQGSEKEDGPSSHLYSKAAEDSIGSKMHKMKDEDRPQAQRVAITMSEARKKGLKVPSAK